MEDDDRVLRVVTSNDGKAREFAAALERVPWRVVRVALEYQEVQADTLEAVAVDSAEWLLEQGTVEPPFVLEDAGLFIDALSGFPGVYSAYVYRTVGCQGILDLMVGVEDRRARFESRIALSRPGGTIEVLRGTCEGAVTLEARGSGGFGFDPVFVPEGADRTFAEMGLEEKEGHSHRGRALDALASRLGSF
jgi:XTP/dITP diphosphohydrolase